jgi:hypothetical protein
MSPGHSAIELRQELFAAVHSGDTAALTSIAETATGRLASEAWHPVERALILDALMACHESLGHDEDVSRISEEIAVARLEARESARAYMREKYPWLVEVAPGRYTRPWRWRKVRPKPPPGSDSSD